VDANSELVERGDPAELVRHVDRLVGARDWDALVDLEGRCRAAVERGKQLWGVAAHIDYRLALDAPTVFAAEALLRSEGRFALGPLPEVAASTHSWQELAPHLPDGPQRELFAHERVVRGDDLRDEMGTRGSLLELPFVLASWEPAYPVATYRAYEVDAGALPSSDNPRAIDLPAAGTPVDDPAAVDALRELTRAWQRDSNGTSEAVAVSGDALSAIAALGPRRARVVEIDLADALAVMAWTAASGGAHSRRRGMAAGRFDAWWAAASLAGYDQPPEPDELGDALAGLRWWAWDAFEPAGGWRLHLAAEATDARLAWAVVASDHV
jgi:hypothetical protein